jgi:hypothetical protein
MAGILAQLQDKLAIAQVNQTAEAIKIRQRHNSPWGDCEIINT